MAPPRLDLLVHGLLCVDPLHLPLLPKALSQTLELPKTQGLHLFIEASLPAISHNSGSSSHIPPFIHDSMSVIIGNLDSMEIHIYYWNKVSKNNLRWLVRTCLVYQFLNATDG